MPRPLNRIFRISEMARPRGGPTWAVLDWAAQQSGEFTVKDLYKVYQKAGGDQGYTSFHTTVGKLTAKPWKDDQEKYALSETRPFEVVKQGSRGAGGATVLRWGIDHPLRDPAQAPADEPDQEEGGLGDALDRLEAGMGRPALKDAIRRWKSLPSLDSAVADIRKGVPKNLQMDALHVAAEHFMGRGKADETDVQDAEREIDRTKGSGGEAHGAGGASQATQPPQDEPESEPDYDEDAETDAGFGATSADPEVGGLFGGDDEEPEPEDEPPPPKATAPAQPKRAEPQAQASHPAKGKWGLSRFMKRK